MNDISSLASLLRENGDKVLNGQSKLSLTSALLRNLNEAFTIIVENNEESDSSFNVINTTNALVEIFHDIQFLYDFVQKTVGLKLSNCAVTGDCGNSVLDICKFRNLKYLELRKIPVHMLHGIQSVRAQLQSVVCIRCVQRLEDLLLDCGADRSSGFVWSDLKEAVFSYNGIDLLDRSLEFAPWLQILDLSHNRISQASAIDCLPNLKYLNMSYNLLESIPTVNKDACRKLQVLVIKNNYIEDISGLVALECLLELDLSCNCLTNHKALSPLLRLSDLTWLSLEGNPLSFHPQHRTRTARHLHDCAATSRFMLDHLPLSKTERLSVGSLGGDAVLRESCKEGTISAGSSSPSERSLIAERGGQSGSKPHQSHDCKRSGRVRKAVISEHGCDAAETELSSSFMVNSIDHLETKKQIETLRERFGEENWLHSQAGLCVQDLLGLHRAVTTPSPAKSGVEISPWHENTAAVTATHVNKAESDVHYVARNPEVVSDSPLASDTLSSDVRFEDNKGSSPEPVELIESDEDEEDEDEGEEQLYLVQRQQLGTQRADEFFLAVTERNLKEREVLSGKTHEKWTMASLLTCTRTGGQTPAATVQLTFDTVRRNRQERVYIMDEKDAQKLVRTLGEVLDARPLTAMNQVVFRCMKCSTQFSQELAPTVSGVGGNVVTCPTCNSTLVIEMEEVPLPSQHRNDQGEKQSVVPDCGPLSPGFNSSPSQSSIGRSVKDTGASAEMCDRLEVTPTVLHSEAQQLSCHSPNSFIRPVKRWDSDIEIISNPSQSSIEVLDEQARLQGGVTPASKQSSEEKQMAPVAILAEHAVVPEMSSHLVSRTGLTESSSSSSLTDSVCTTYEIHSESQSLRPGVVAAKLEENVITLDDRNSSTDTRANGGMGEAADKFSKHLLDKPEHEDESTTVLSKMCEEKSSSQMNYSSMLEGLLQSVGSKLSSRSSEKVLDSSNSRETVTGGNDIVKYSYTDFAVVDHRVKLHLYLHVFHQEQEELLFLLRAQIIPQSSRSSYPGCLVMSSRNVYVLQITGEEGDDPELWLRKVDSSSVEMLIVLFPLMWRQGIGMELMREGGEYSSFLFIFQDQNHTVNFLSFLTGVELPGQCRLEHEVTESQNLAVEQLLLSAAAGDDADSTVCSCAVSFSCRIQKNKENKEVGMGAIIITTDLLLMMDNLQWLFPKSDHAMQTYSSQKISNLIEVEIEDHCQMNLHFLDEAAGSDESWTLKLGTESTMKALVSAISIPWEQLFSVPLQIVNKTVLVVPN
ncbi:serine/threonine-protein kinase 11-interacting protein [Zootermopsis nevadensis]|uniref:Serine/threonine-protein kinase 11-interacting protein n=1 Tax=Zootermopsis nevadensis TaxID=136037 RepID=A0A067RJP4_ZOONE|nr:serine/threonine-protein kinase 11-interacting protein [Zootermopsis nevadensis]KDR23218.1 Serine/threonine kinase 11-interacting protein [Zootermopsis nevadensis]